LAVSLDDIGPRLEYQRKNAKWDQMVANFNRIKAEVPNVQLMISPTVSVFNVLSISEMHQTLFSENHVRVEDVVPTLLVYPKEFNIQLLPDLLKGEARNRIEEHLNWLQHQSIHDSEKMEYVLRQYRNILTYLSHPGDHKARENFPSKIQKLDALREENFEEVFPELKSLLQ
jgi:hypothetical protein